MILSKEVVLTKLYGESHCTAFSTKFEFYMRHILTHAYYFHHGSYVPCSRYATVNKSIQLQGTVVVYTLPFVVVVVTE